MFIAIISKHPIQDTILTFVVIGLLLDWSHEVILFNESPKQKHLKKIHRESHAVVKDLSPKMPRLPKNVIKPIMNRMEREIAIPMMNLST